MLTAGAEVNCDRVLVLFSTVASRSPKLNFAVIYCTAIFNSAGGVTCDPPAEIFLPADPEVTCDRPKISADSTFGGTLSNKFAPQGRNLNF